MDREDVGHCFSKVVVNSPSETDSLYDRREVVIEEHQRSGLASHVGTASTHRDADMCRLERRCVVNAIAGHGDDIAIGFQRFNDLQLLFRQNSSKDTYGPNALS